MSAVSLPPLSVTFPRAIDAARDPLEALRACLALRVDRVLSSGHAATAPLGAAVLAQMVRLAAESAEVDSAAAASAASGGDGGGGSSRGGNGGGDGGGSGSRTPLVVMAGGGVTASNVAALVASTGVREVHGSARVRLDGRMRFRPPPEKIVYMGSELRLEPEAEFGLRQATEESVRAFVNALAIRRK